MRLILMGTPNFVVPIFERIASGHEIAAVFTRAPKPAGRKKLLTKSPVHIWAESRGIPVYTDVNDIEIIKGQKDKGTKGQAMNEMSFCPSDLLSIDYIIVAAYGVILRDNVLNFAPCVNIHPSDLPKYRGPSPMTTAIYNGDKTSAVCLMQVAPAVDSGDILACREFYIGEDDTIADIENKVSQIGGDMLVDYLSAPENYQPAPQVGQPSFTHKWTGADEVIDWSKSPREIHNQIRSIGGRTKINGIDVKILETKLVDDKLEIMRIQPNGKNPMPMRDFLNGLRGAELTIGE
ncbi:MAG: hypothetical protein LBJ18_03290 [Rickettsiales bacterium]|jgi:methionyl-tRNA formyltransferase|nr:hypothetical protein [Rickettsiales bacterium]